ncbi:MAG: tRNA lysidine(34) synthetase TilS [bacterium]|nr:tRNA lysidine(34) synthetase TilS [bacterium]MDD5353871.1 tRNA lysidine(34) synthetase TilS [bacterium]MDD5756156.1 tRNA lysidine(34) synthetase TilS [bacterium]
MLVKQVEEFIEKQGLLKKGDKILVAVSGGVDSVALLRVLKTLSYKYHWALQIAHFNHGLRGPAADRDEAFVRRVARTYDLPFHAQKQDVRKYARKHGLSIEEAARLLRYDFLEKMALDIQADKIAVAHNANDQAETVLLFLLRGTGKTGLAGMPVARGRIVRPLLSSWRQDIETFARQQKLPFRTDATNRQTAYLRNRIRLKLLPELAKYYNPQIYQHLLHLSALEREEDQFLQEQSNREAAKCLEQKPGATVLNSKRFSKLPVWLQRRLIRLIAPLPYEQVEKIRSLAINKGAHKMLPLRRNLYCRREYDKLIFSAMNQAKKAETAAIYTLAIPGETQIPELGLKITARLKKKAVLFKRTKRKNLTCLDAGTVYGPLRLRTRQAGDRFQPYGLGGTKKLKDYFIEQKIGINKRDLVPVIVDDQGIISLCTLGRIDDRVKISPETKTIIEIEVN